MQKVQGIYSLRGLKESNTVKIKHLANIRLKDTEHVPDEKLKDECFDVEKGVKALVYKCHITDNYINKNRKLPMLYISVVLDKPLRSILLYRIYLYFTITDNIKSEKDLLKKKLSGYYSMEVMIGDKKIVIEEKNTIFPGRNEVIQQMKDFILSEEMKEMLDGLVALNDEMFKSQFKEEFEEHMEGLKIPENVISLADYNIED